MSNQDEILSQHYAFIQQISAQLELVKASPEGITPEVLTFFENAIAAQVEWLASHDILFPDQVMGR
ncbi:hypothetical protein ABLI39_02655 [Pseudarthrobacter sp. B907]|uniref:hypothetical protein n=1 Tax=Pseudarthrobacter sp. B907 TaxID=3158261 RepID=UPI0032DAF086